MVLTCSLFVDGSPGGTDMRNPAPCKKIVIWSPFFRKRHLPGGDHSSSFLRR
jgi:hypothetical protein